MNADDHDFAALIEERDQARKALFWTERAQLEGRVTDWGLYRHTLRKAEERVRALNEEIAEMENHD